MWADQKDINNKYLIAQNWKSASPYFWSVMYDKNFAGKIGLADSSAVKGVDQANGKYSSILQQIIAYSAIDDGATKESMPFGNTGIRALYDDANDLGKAVVKAKDSSVTISDTTYTNISKVLVQYAEQLALNKVLNSSATASVLKGVLTYLDLSSNHTLTVDMSDSSWRIANTGFAPASIVGKDDLIEGVLGSASKTVHANDNHHQIKSKVAK